MRDVPQTDRLQAVKDYVRDRLRREIGDGPRGTNARIARALGISTAHVSNLTTEPPSRQVGEDVARRAAEYWGMTYAALERAAVGDAGEDPGPENAVEREERYVAMPAVRLMARTDGMPDDFVEAFEAQLDFDYQPSADDLWTIFKGEYARWRGKRAGSGGDPVSDLDRPHLRTARKKR